MVTGTDALTVVSVGTLLGILGVTSERIRDVDAVSSLGENHPRVRLIASILFHGSLGGMLASVSGGELPLIGLALVAFLVPAVGHAYWRHGSIRSIASSGE